MLTEGADIPAEDAVKKGLYWTKPTELTATAPTAGLKLQVVEVTDTADGQTALKIQVL